MLSPRISPSKRQVLETLRDRLPATAEKRKLRAPWCRVAAGVLVMGMAVAVATPGQGAPPVEKTASADRLQVEVSSKIIEFSGEAVQSLQDQNVKTQGRVKELLDRIVAISTGKEAPAANFAITQLLPDKDFQVLIRTLNQLKGVDLLSAPRVTTRSGQKATVEIVREFNYPTGYERKPGPDGKIMLTPTKFDKKNTGVTLTVEPEVAPAHDVIDLKVSWQLVSLEGWVRMSDGQPLAPDTDEKAGVQPVFITQAVDSFISVPTGSVLVLGSLRQHRGTWYNDFSHPPVPAKTETLVLTFVSLDLVQAPAPPPPAPDPTASPSSPAPSTGKTDLPYGVPVPGKPGYVTSPYAPDAGYVDLRGFARGSGVRDPYTGKLFLVP